MMKPTIEERLAASRLIWLTTVDKDRTPHPTLVWFLWDGETFLIYSRPDMPKLANIEANPSVALNLDAMARGNEEVTIIHGQARVDPGTVPVVDNPDYLALYREMIEDDLGMTVEQFSDMYSVPIRVSPTGSRSW